jgi:hypothetical protein
LYSPISILYEDFSESTTLHLTLKNLSGTSKKAGPDGDILIEVSYELAG